MRVVKFNAYGANGTTDPRKRDGGGAICSSCLKQFSYWDILQMSPSDLDVKCAECKGIQIELITEPNDRR